VPGLAWINVAENSFLISRFTISVFGQTSSKRFINNISFIFMCFCMLVFEGNILFHEIHCCFVLKCEAYLSVTCLQQHCQFITKAITTRLQMALLEYENQIFLDAFQEDGLLVMAKYLYFCVWCCHWLNNCSFHFCCCKTKIDAVFIVKTISCCMVWLGTCTEDWESREFLLHFWRYIVILEV